MAIISTMPRGGGSPGSGISASNVSYDNTSSGIGATNAQDAIDAALQFNKFALTNRAVVQIFVKLTDGTPVRNVPIQGTGIDGYAYTDERGNITRDYNTLETTSVSFSITQPYDLTALSQTTISTPIKSQDILTYVITADKKDLAGQEITLTSGIYFFTEFAPKMTWWGCGGGGSGAVGGNSIHYNYNGGEEIVSGYSYRCTSSASAGAGGYTKKQSEPDAEIRFYNITVGSGGVARTATVYGKGASGSYGSSGAAGGSTYIKNNVTEENVFEVLGGSGGLLNYYNRQFDTTDYSYNSSFDKLGVAGAAGGSGSSASSAFSNKSDNGTRPVIGTRGINGAGGASITVSLSYQGTKTKVFSGGTGQGTNTYVWEDTSKTLCCSAGDVEQPSSTTGNVSTKTAASGINYGDGGNAIMPLVPVGLIDGYGDYKDAYVNNCSSGAGKAGILYARFA